MSKRLMQTIPLAGFTVIAVTPENEAEIASLVDGFGHIIPPPDGQPKVERVPDFADDPFTGIVVPTVSRDGKGTPYLTTALDNRFNPRAGDANPRTSMDIPLGGFLAIAEEPYDANAVGSSKSWPFRFLALENATHLAAFLQNQPTTPGSNDGPGLIG